MNYIGDILEIRKKRKVSVAKLSKITGIPDDRIYKWESGVGNPKAEDSEKLQKWLETPAIVQENDPEISDINLKSEEIEKDPRIDDLIRIADKNADAVVSSTKSVERLTAMLEKNSDAEREKNVSNLQNYSGLVAVIREIGIKAGYWKDQDTAEKELNRFVALHKL